MIEANDEASFTRAATALDRAAIERSALPALPIPWPLSLEDGYAVQRRVVAHRLARGERQIGVKVGLTREEKWAACGANDVLIGILTDSMLIAADAAIPLDHFIAAGVEPELAFRLGRPLSGLVTMEEALSAIDGVAPALEIIDSRLANTAFVLHDIIADNSNTAGAVVGAWREPPDDLEHLATRMIVDGVIVAEGNTRTVSGHPLRSVCSAVRLLMQNGGLLEAGSIILSGSLAPARPLRRGQRVGCWIEGLGEVSATVS